MVGVGKRKFDGENPLQYYIVQKMEPSLALEKTFTGML
jgi:hypothetical protein